MNIDNMLLALVIGDGFIDKRGCIGFHHSIAQKNWLLYKVGILTSFGFSVRIKETERESYGKIRGFINARTLTTNIGKELREILYSTGEKIIPTGLANNFGYKEWAIIYQDDGRQNKIAHYNAVINKEKVRVECEPFVNRYCICSQGFNIPSQVELQNSLANLGIESSLYKVRGGYGKQIVISRAKSKVDFHDGILPYVVDSMEYKLSAKPCLSY